MRTIVDLVTELYARNITCTIAPNEDGIQISLRKVTETHHIGNDIKFDKHNFQFSNKFVEDMLSEMWDKEAGLPINEISK